MVKVRSRTNSRKHTTRKGDRREAFFSDPSKVHKHPQDVQKRRARAEARKQAKKYTATRESTCCICTKTIWIGQTIQRIDMGVRHDTCRRKETKNSDV